MIDWFWVLYAKSEDLPNYTVYKFARRKLWRQVRRVRADVLASASVNEEKFSLIDLSRYR